MRFNINNLLIIGDSYSTFKGYIPEGYSFYYDDTESRGLDVRHVEETWWHKLLNVTGSKLALNNSWSGSTVCYTAYDKRDCSQDSSFIFRFREIIKSGFLESSDIDTVILFGGTNDSWANSPLGKAKLSDFDESDLYYVLPAICYFIKLVKESLPNSNILYVINNSLKPEIVDTIKTASDHFGIEYVELKNIDKKNGHPTVKGMDDIFKEIMDFLK